MFDIVTIGSATVDVFVETEDARIVYVSTKDSSNDFMAYPYGSKMEIENFSTQIGGGGLNTAINFANLGFKTSAICKIGSDFTAQMIKNTISERNVSCENIVCSHEHSTGFSIILTSFEGDRTVLAHRGANANLKLNDINLDVIKNTKWLYLAPLNGDTNKILDDVAQFAEENNVNMAINLGTTSIKMNKDDLRKVLETAEIIIMNKEEVQLLAQKQIRPDTKDVKYSHEFIHPDLKEMIVNLQRVSGKIVLITDGKRGVYACDGKFIYKCPEFPAVVVSTLGAGDAFASTFVATIEKFGDVKKALEFASVNAASIVSHFGAQDGFLTFEEIEAKLNTEPDFKCEKISL